MCGFLLPPPSAKLELNAPSLGGSQEGFRRAAQSGSTVLHCCCGCEMAQLHVTCQLFSLSASLEEDPQFLALNGARSGAEAASKKSMSQFFLCCLQVCAASEMLSAGLDIAGC